MNNSEDKTVNSDISEDINLYKSKEYQARLTEFEGPLDILLHFVKVDELDIYNIPISKITKDFLNYINYMQLLDIELAGEFLVMASELMKIKARMMIPQIDIEGNVIEEDPRLTLVRKLLEYKRFKDVSLQISEFEEEQRKRIFRRNFDNDPKETEREIEDDPSLKNVTIFNLIKAYKRAISSIRKEVVHPIELLDITPENQREYIFQTIDEKGQVDFLELIAAVDMRLRVICIFLAILQLALDGEIEIVVDNSDMTKFFIRRRVNGFTEVVHDN
ncbi:MAG TPA: segregation/condensation protein A [Ignavibacteria bacterium]|nr:segregation/condensation protein A [Ignavibacteria bacterium]